MAALGNQSIASSYEQLLHVDRDGGGNTTNLVDIKDGDNGTTFALQLATDKVHINGSLGIGVTDPAKALEIAGSGAEAELIYLTSTQSANTSNRVRQSHRLLTDSQERTSFSLLSGFNTITDGSRNSIVEFKTSNAGTFGTAMTIDGGKVGIGTSSPSTLLHLKSATPALRIEATASSARDYDIKTDGDELFIEGVGGSSGSLQIGENGVFGIQLDLQSSFKLDTNSRISLSNNDSGSGNTVFGKLAGNNLNANASFNLLIGEDAGTSLTGGTNSGDENCIVGTNAVDVASDAFRVTVLGTSAMRGALTTAAEGTVAIGYTALNVLTSGQANVAVGYETLLANTTGQYNTAIGHLSMRTNIDGDHNTALGYASLYSFEAGSDGEGNNVAIGSNASFHLDTGQQNTMVGSSAGQSSAGTITYADNVGVGYKALFAITTGTNNVAIGSQAGDAMTDNVHNVIIGKSAFGSANSGESFNIVIGADAGTAIDNASADNNILIGQDAGTGGSGAIASCIAIGRNAMNSTGTNAQTGTIAIGHDSLTALTSGERNTAIGYASLDAEDAGSNNTAVGYETLTAQNNDTGANTAVGMRAGLAVTTGYSNTLLGSGSGATLQGGYQNTYVGRDADGADGRINSTAVGFGTTAQADNSVTLGNDNVTAVYMASNSGAIVHATGLQNSGFYAYRLSGSKSVTADTLTDLFTVGHSHNYTITLWCLNNYTNQGQWFGQSQSVYGAATVTETLEKRNGSLSSIAVAYNNTGYKLQVTVGGVNATVYYTIDGLGSQDLVAL